MHAGYISVRLDPDISDCILSGSKQLQVSEKSSAVLSNDFKTTMHDGKYLPCPWSKSSSAQMCDQAHCLWYKIHILRLIVKIFILLVMFSFMMYYPINK